MGGYNKDGGKDRKGSIYMKREKLLTRLAVLVCTLMAVSAFASCDNSFAKAILQDNLFLGIWNRVTTSTSEPLQLVFTGSHWVLSSPSSEKEEKGHEDASEDEDIVLEGTYTHENTVATMIISSDESMTSPLTATIVAGALRLMYGGYVIYVFTR
jgi:hypothetical protein